MSDTGADPLVEFAKEFVGNMPVVPPSVFGGVTFVGDFAELVLMRQPPFQVQLCLCKPNSEIPDHRHPNVNAFLVYVTGQIDFRIGGQKVYGPGEIRETEDGKCEQNNHWMHLPPGTLHGATIGPKGGAFITVQHWLNGEPDSVEKDWEGPLLSKEHGESIKAQEAIPV